MTLIEYIESIKAKHLREWAKNYMMHLLSPSEANPRPEGNHPVIAAKINAYFVEN